MTDGEFWCVGCVAAHPVQAFYRDARSGRPYGPCKKVRKARQRERDAAKREALQTLRALLVTFQPNKDAPQVLPTPAGR